MNAAFAKIADEPVQPVRKRCGVCARSFTSEGWGRLPMVATVPSARVQPHLSVSIGWAIELRTCTCGALLAARS